MMRESKINSCLIIVIVIKLPGLIVRLVAVPGEVI